MADRGYWARLGLEGIEDGGPDDHPLGFAYGTIENSLLPRLAVLREELTTPAALEAFKALWMELDRYCRQTNSVLEEMREMARDLKNLEDNVAYEYRDLQSLRDLYMKHPGQMRFDAEAYKRSSVVTRDLTANRFQIDWEYQAAVGRDLDRQMADTRARKEKEFGERHAARVREEKAKREAELLQQLGVLYETSPAGVDPQIPRNVRQDMHAAEERFKAMGFDVHVNGQVRRCTKSWGEFLVYADPRSGSSLRFNVYKGSECLHSFWLKDKVSNAREKLEAQLHTLQEQDRATAGFLNHERVADALRVSPAGVERLIAKGMPVTLVGSAKRFDWDAVLKWVKANPT